MKKFILLIVSSIGFALPALAEFWNLPQQISSDNVEISFEVDSTWHLVKGNVNHVQGKIWLENPKDQKSIRANITMPIINFDTDNSSRDEKMRTVMHAEQFPLVEFLLNTNLSKTCGSVYLDIGGECHDIIGGILRISGVEKQVSIPIVIHRESNRYRINGETKIDWADYGVEDPSILIAKLDPTVKIKFNVSL